MKTLLMILCLLCASVAWGQASVSASVLNAEPQMVQFFSHPQHAAQVGMGIERRVLERSVPIAAHGVLPLWEVAPVSQPIPLGDVARSLREEHETVRKAERVMTN